MEHIENNLKLIIISDGTGETAAGLARAAMAQFKDKDVYFTRFKNVRTKEQIDGIFAEAGIHHDMIVYTLVSRELREYISELSREKRVRSVDLMGPMLTEFSNFFEIEPTSKPGLLREVNDQYFQRVAAMEFSLNHDDGRNIESLHLCDVVLVGISRTSKTPLSMFLSFHGLKVVNVPMIHQMDLPKALKEIDQRKIFALTIDPEALQEIRQNRLKGLGAGSHQGEYAEMGQIITEVEWANSVFAANKRWPVLNVTGKALEEIATEILKFHNMRKTNQFKFSKRYK